MPRVLERDPSWLARPSPGFQLFRPDKSAKVRQHPDVRHDGALRKIAHRGSEVFVAVGNELRWSDLGLLKDVGEADDLKHSRRDKQQVEQAHKVLETPVSRPITQLSISPNGDYIAILTSHTCHIGILPSSERLTSHDTSPLKLRCFQLGPTAHVLEQAPLVSALWHPLSPYGDCLVTITKDACVRLWELDRDNRSSFDEPALAVDLKKLANATSTQADFSASKYGTSKGFSPDNEEMQVAAARFGGRGGDDEHGWASMTLWIAMVEGDVYALCPFVPSKWRASATMLPSLSTGVVAKARALSRDGDVSESERRITDQQVRWVAEVDAQEPLLVPGATEYETHEVYDRPERPGPIPKLQGPFQISPELDFGEITDVYVIAAKIDEDELFDEDYEDASAAEGLSVGITCLATITGKVHVCLDLDGVEAEWLPSRRSRTFSPDDMDGEKELLLFETIDLAHPEGMSESWPTFTPSPLDRYDLFTTQPTGVYGLSFKPWISWLEDELANLSVSGVGFRLETLLSSGSTFVDQPIRLPTEPICDISAAVALIDPNVGYMVLTSAINTPHSAILDQPYQSHPLAPDTQPATLPAPEPRAPYQPAEEFYQSSALPQLLKTVNEKRLLGSDLKAQVRFSPATLQLMTEAHRLLSSETHRLGLAAADLFRRCERMRSELQDQVRRVKEINEKVERVVDKDDGEEEEVDGGGKLKLEHRIETSRKKTSELDSRVMSLRKKMARLGGKQLSAKEKAFAEEVEKMERNISPTPALDRAPTDPSAILHMQNSASTDEVPHVPKDPKSLTSRFEAVHALQARLLEQAKEAGAEEGKKEDEVEGGKAYADVGNDFRKQKMLQVMGLLERETALVDAVTERLARLSRT